jgi:hypothetical protein
MRIDDSPPGASGRWVRRGSRIVLLPGGAGVQREEGEVRPRITVPPRGRTRPRLAAARLTPCDFIHANIDVSAQRALHRLLRGDAASVHAAAQMLAAVRNGVLGGIYQEDQKVPALRARGLGRGWWELVAAYRKPSAPGTACVNEPAGTPPLLVFRKSLASDHARLATELRTAFAGCVPRQPSPVPTGRPCAPAAPAQGRTSKELCVSPASLEFGARQTVQQLVIRNCAGRTSLRWQADAVPSWISLSQSSGSTPAGGASTITVTVNGSGLPDGIHRGTVRVASPDTLTTQTVPVGFILAD